MIVRSHRENTRKLQSIRVKINRGTDENACNMLRGPTWPGSIQQDLIEKLWVAILTCDVAEPKAPIESYGEKKTEGATANDDEGSEESRSESESDWDLDLSGLGLILPRVDRFDLLSVAREKLAQRDATADDDPEYVRRKNGQADDVDGAKEEEKAQTSTLTWTEKSPEAELHNLRESEIYGLPSKSNDDSAARLIHSSSSPSCGAKPKVFQAKVTQTGLKGPRPRPDSLDFSSCRVKSKIPQLSPVSSSAASRLQNWKPLVKSHVSNSMTKGPKPPDRKTLTERGQAKTSRIPISPVSQPRAWPLHARAHLLDVVPRRRLLSDPRQSRDYRVIKSNPDIWRRAVTPDAPRPYPMHRLTNNTKDNGEKPEAKRFRQRGNSCNLSMQKLDTGPHKRASCNSNVVPKAIRRVDKEDKTAWNEVKSRQMDEQKTVKSRQNNEEKTGISRQAKELKKGISRQRNEEKAAKSRQNNEEKTGKSRITVSPSVPRSNTTRGNTTKFRRPQTSPNDSKSPELSSRTANKNTCTVFGNPNVPGCQSTYNKQRGKPKQESIKQTRRNTDNLPAETRGTEEKGTGSVNDDDDSKEDKISKGDGTCDPELHEADFYGSEVEVSRLEDCLKEAILGVFEGLPEGWILVPEHTAELFSSLTSVVDSFPRPDHARDRVLEAIVDAHSRRPCGKGEIAALNNAHLLLYVGLKLCCLHAHIADTYREEEAMQRGRTTKREQNCRAFERELEDRHNNTEASSISTATDKKERGNSKDAEVGFVERNGVSSCQLLTGTCPTSDEAKEEKKNIIACCVNGNGALRTTVLKILRAIQKCEGSFDRLMMCLLLGSRAPGRGSGWFLETEEEAEKVRDLRFVLEHLKCIKGCRVSEVASAPLWSCGSSPVVLAALAESPRLVLALLQYGAGGSPANQYARCYTNGVYLAIAYLVRKLESQFKKPSPDGNPQDPPDDEDEPPPEGAVNAEADPEGLLVHIAQGQENNEVREGKDNFDKRDLLQLAGHTPTTICLRFLLRSVSRIPIKFLRDQLGSCGLECGRDIAYLLPHPCCLQPPTLLHLSRTACREHLRAHDLLPQVIGDLDVPETLKDYLNLLRD